MIFFRDSREVDGVGDLVPKTSAPLTQTVVPVGFTSPTKAAVQPLHC